MMFKGLTTFGLGLGGSEIRIFRRIILSEIVQLLKVLCEPETKCVNH